MSLFHHERGLGGEATLPKAAINLQDMTFVRRCREKIPPSPLVHEHSTATPALLGAECFQS